MERTGTLQWLGRMYQLALTITSASTFGLVMAGKLPFQLATHFWLLFTALVFYDWWGTEQTYREAGRATRIRVALYLLYVVILLALPWSLAASALGYVKYSIVAWFWFGLSSVDLLYFHVSLREQGVATKARFELIAYLGSTALALVGSALTALFADRPAEVAWGLTATLVLDFLLMSYLRWHGGKGNDS